MKNITLTKRHKRLLSSLFFVLEQKIEAIEHVIKSPKDNASYMIEQDLDTEKLKRLSENCTDLRASLDLVSEKLQLSKRKISQSHYIQTMQSQMWESISDAFSSKLKGYGNELIESARKTDPDMEIIAEKIDQLRL